MCDTPASDVVKKGGGPMIAHSLHVAILDDEASIRKAISRLLTTAGMVARTYATSGELFESIALKCPDCLLLDLQMPEMSGLDVLKCLNQRHIRIPTIVITGHDEKYSREACMNAGAVAYVLKPLDADILIETIENICGKP
jgi:FixJ family two-component response regulator